MGEERIGVLIVIITLALLLSGKPEAASKSLDSFRHRYPIPLILASYSMN